MSTSSPEVVSSLLMQLVETMLPASSTVSGGAAAAETRSQQASYLHGLGRRMLAGGPRSHIRAADEQHMVQHAKREIALRVGGEPGYNAAVQFEQLYRKLVSQSAAQQAAGLAPLMAARPQLLYLLQALQGQGSASEQAMQGRAFASNFSQSQHMVPTVPTPAQSHSQAVAAAPAQQMAPYGQAVTSSSLGSALAQGQTAKLLLQHSSSSVSESELLRDLLYTLLGGNGNLVQYHAGKDAFLVLPAVRLSPELRTLVQRIAELGWLYRKVSGYVAQVMEGEQVAVRAAAPVPAPAFGRLASQPPQQPQTPLHEHSGKIEQSFAATLRDELNDYIRLVTLLETQVESQLRTSAAAPSPHGLSLSTASPAHATSQFTLRRMWVWVQDPLQRLSLLAVLVDAARGVKGGCLASVVGAHLRHGDPFVVGLMKRIMRKTCVPLFEMIHRWVCNGVLADPYSEFFIQSHAGIPAERMWLERFSLRREMLPSFLPKALVLKILGIGKAVNFVRFNCKESNYSNKLHVDFNDMFSSGTDLTSFASSIDASFTAVNAHLLSLLTTKYNLLGHASALKKYLLLSQGDFIQHLLDLLQVELDKPAKELSTPSLLSIVETAKRNSTARFDPEDLSARLGIKKLPLSTSSSAAPGSETGWDVFSLEYRLDDSPLGVIFSESHLARYMQLFNFLLRLKRVELRLNRSWQVQSKAGHSLRLRNLSRSLASSPASSFSPSGATAAPSPLDPLLKQCNGLRHEMMHLLTNTHSYMMFEVLESAWAELIRKIFVIIRPAGAAAASSAGPASSSATATTATAAASSTSTRHAHSASSVGGAFAAPLSSANGGGGNASIPAVPAPHPFPAAAAAATAHPSREQTKVLDLDGLILAHKIFLQQIMDKVGTPHTTAQHGAASKASTALLGGDSQPLLPQLQSLFKLILSFSVFSERLYDFLHAEMDRREAAQRQVARSEKAGTWGVSAAQSAGRGDAAVNAALVAALADFLVEFQRLAHDWHAQLRTFMKALKSTNREAHDRLGGGVGAAGGGGAGARAATAGEALRSSPVYGDEDDEEEESELDRSAFGSPLPVSKSSAAAAAVAAMASPNGTGNNAPSQFGGVLSARAQRAATNLHDLEFLRFRLDFNEYYRNNKEEHARRHAAYVAMHGQNGATSKAQSARIPAPSFTAGSRPGSRTATGAAASFVNPRAWEE